MLRDVVEEDIAIFFEQQREPEAVLMAAFPAREREIFTEHWQRILASDDVEKKTIVFENDVAGNIVIFEREGKRLVGYWIGKEFWGKGLATRALTELLGEVTERPLYAYVATSNVASIRVLEKCGFALVGSETHFDEALGDEIEEALMVLS